MKIDKQTLEDHQVKLTVEVDPQSLETTKRRAAKKVAKQVKIPGFRPGKAPYQVVVRHVGEASILDEAIELLVNDIYPKVISEAEIEPYGPGTLENIVSIDPPELEFIVPIMSEVELGEYQSIRVPYEIQVITEEDVDNVLSNLQERQAVYESVDRTAKPGDMVYIRISAERNNASEDEDHILINERSMPILIRDDSQVDDEWPYTGFSQELIGLTNGDEKIITHTFSEDATFDTLRGTEADIRVNVDDIKSRTLPEINDEFAQSIGDFVNLEELKAEIREDLEEQSQSSYNSAYDNKVLDEIVNISIIKYPPQMLDKEMDIMIDQIENDLQRQNLDIDLYLKSREIDMEELREEVKPSAETRLKRTLTLAEVSKAEDIKVDPDDVQDEATRTLDEIQRVLPEKESRKYTQPEVTANIFSNILLDMTLLQTQERLRDIARGLLETQETGRENDEDGLEKDISLSQIEDDIEQQPDIDFRDEATIESENEEEDEFSEAKREET